MTPAVLVASASAQVTISGFDPLKTASITTFCCTAWALDTVSGRCTTPLRTDGPEPTDVGTTVASPLPVNPLPVVVTEEF